VLANQPAAVRKNLCFSFKKEGEGRKGSGFQKMCGSKQKTGGNAKGEEREEGKKPVDKPYREGKTIYPM